jgi:PPM family protein phosphatase
MSLPLYIHGSTDVGRQRQRNEDSHRIEALPDGSRLLVVCDGMGGHEAGDVASAVACQRMAESIAASTSREPPRALYQAITEAHRAVNEAALARGTVGMGTTLVAAWVLGERCYVGWVGDSRLYHFRDGVALDKTVDHTRVQQMLQRGILTPEQARQHPEAHVLVQALGVSPDAQHGLKPEVWNEPLELRRGDVLLLCSDGLYDFIEDGELYPLMERFDYQAAAERLVQTANARGGSDNITAILLVAGQPQVPSAGGASVSEPRRETVPELPAVVAGVEPTAPPAPASPGVPVAVVAEGLGRRVPLAWVVGAAVVGLAVGVLLGWFLAAGSARDAAAPVQAGSASGGSAQPGPAPAPVAPTLAQSAVPPVQPVIAQGTEEASAGTGTGAPDAGVP